jgi:hypothetical protein
MPIYLTSFLLSYPQALIRGAKDEQNSVKELENIDGFAA